MADSPRAFTAKMGRCALAYGAVGPAIARSGSAAMKLAVEASMRRVAPSGRLRNVGKRGGRLGVATKVTGDTAIVKATGPWNIIEGNTKPHRIAPHLTQAASDFVAGGGGRQKAVLPPVGPRAAVHHPGTTGKHPWRTGVELGKREVAKVAEREGGAPIRAIF